VAGLTTVDDLKLFQRELRPDPLQFPRDDGNALSRSGNSILVSGRSVSAIELFTGVSPWKSRMLSKNSRRRTLPSLSVIIFRYSEIGSSPMWR
jgi:hypothetical protein